MVYDSAKCIEALAAYNAWDYGEAVEWFQFNTLGALWRRDDAAFRQCGGAEQA